MTKLTKAERELLERVPEEFGVIPAEHERAMWDLRREGEELVEYRQRALDGTESKAKAALEWRLTRLGLQVLGRAPARP
jgi:hypothetical protein